MAIGFIIKGKERDIIILSDSIQRAEKEYNEHKKEIKKFLGKATSSGPIAKKNLKVSITNLVIDLKSKKFFDKPKNWNDIQKALEELGYTYPLNSLTDPLQRLVRKGELGRIKKDDKWHYVKR